MKVTVNKIINGREGFQELLNAHVPPSLSLKLARLLQRFANEITAYEVAKEKIIEAYGERDDKNNLVYTDGGVKLQKKFIETAQKELQTLLNTEIEIDISPISLSELGDNTFTPAAMMLIECFITE